MLKPSERLRANPLFKQVFKAGRSYAEPLVALHVLKLPDSPFVRETGFSVSKKVGNAVVRNRTKRRMRAIVAGLLPALPHGFLTVVVARSAAADASYEQLAASLTKAYRRAGLLYACPPPPSSDPSLGPHGV
jgi:ribonuclease P protein component